MELGPIFRALMHQKGRFWLVALEVAFTLAIVVNCVNLALDMRAEYSRPSGLDEDHLISIRTDPFAPAMAEEGYRDGVRERDLQTLRSLPGVADAVAISQIPLSGGGSATGRRPQGSTDDPSSAPYFVVTTHALDTLGVELEEGRDLTQAEVDQPEDAYDGGQPVPTLVTRTMADKLYPNGDALGKVIESAASDGSSPERNLIVGIMDQMPNSWPDWDEGRGTVMLMPGKPGDERRMFYMVRTEPGALDSVFAQLDQALLGVEPGRLVEAKTMTEVKRDTYSDRHALVTVLSGVIFLLVFVTVLGVVGLTSFSVTQRRRQIGTRRALGATRADILRYFLVENWLVIGLGLTLGVALTYGLNYALSEISEAPKLDGGLLVGGAALLWLCGLAAALFPALRASRVAPVVATRTV